LRLKLTFGAAALLYVIAIGHACEASGAAQPITVQFFLAACQSDDRSVRLNKCDHYLAGAYIASIMAISDDPAAETSEYTLCLPPMDEQKVVPALYREDMLRWLKARPELRNVSMVQASIIATTAIYKCKRKAVDSQR
jgi:hypothetical protein